MEGEHLNLISTLVQQVLQVLFSNDADVTGGLTIQTTLKSPTINAGLPSERAQATIVTNQSSKQTIDGTLVILVSGPSANETTGQFIASTNNLDDFLADQFIGKWGFIHPSDNS